MVMHQKTNHNNLRGYNMYGIIIGIINNFLLVLYMPGILVHELIREHFINFAIIFHKYGSWYYEYKLAHLISI